MEWPRVTIDAAVLTAAVRIHTGLKTNVRAVVIADDRAGSVPKELRSRQRILIRIPILIGFQINFFESVGRIAGSSASWDRLCEHRLNLSSQSRKKKIAF